jgi:hypothetical protein
MPDSLCEACCWVRVIMTPRGSRFLLCTMSATDPRFDKYPRQPVIRCKGFRGIEEHRVEAPREDKTE